MALLGCEMCSVGVVVWEVYDDVDYKELWCCVMVLCYGVLLWCCVIVLCYGVVLWCCVVVLCCGVVLWCSVMVLCY